jgi:hypothetical protein
MCEHHQHSAALHQLVLELVHRAESIQGIQSAISLDQSRTPPISRMALK